METKSMKQHMGMRTANAISNTVIHVLLVIISVIWLVPFVCIVLQSLRVESTWQVGYIIPQKWGLDNFKNLLSTNFPKWYLNTFITALVTAALQTIIILCMSYTLSRFRFKARKPLMKLVYIASSGMGYYVSKGFFDTIPKSLDEAARIDGATRAQVLWKIILPLAGPIVIYTLLTGFMGPWGDYVFANYISFGNSSGMNVAVGMYNWLTPDQINNNYTMFCAGGVVVAIPVVILFMCLQKYYVEGVTGGAVKG